MIIEVKTDQLENGPKPVRCLWCGADWNRCGCPEHPLMVADIKADVEKFTKSLCKGCYEVPGVELKIPRDFHDYLNEYATVDAESQLYERAVNSETVEKDGFFLIEDFCSSDCLELKMEMDYQDEKD